MQFLATIVQGPHHSIFEACTIPPFRFQPRNRSMDWRRMSVLDVDRVTREMDVATLQENLTDITFCTLDREVCSHCSKPLDQALLNVLHLAQLSIEYLMHCQDFLTTRVAQLELHLQASLGQQSQSQQELDSRAEELRGLQEERHRQRKMIKDLQQLLQRSGGQSYYMCHLCEKTFLSASYLWSHLQRRHEGTAQGEKQKQEVSMEQVVRDLRAQLTSTQEELTALLRKQQQLQEAKTTCKRERDAKAIFEEWKEELSEEIDQQKRVFWDEKLAALQSRSGMCSNLGSLQDVDCEELLRQTQEFEDLRILKETKIQERELMRTFHELEKDLAANNKELQDKNQELRRENKMLRRENNKLQEEKEKMQQENEKLQKEKEKLQKVNEKLQKESEKLQRVNERLQEESEKSQENEKLQEENEKLQKVKEKLRKVNEKLRKEKEKVQKESEKLQKENERLHDLLCQLHVTASQSQQHIMSLSTQMQQQARLITSQEMTQTLSCRKVKESEDSQDEQAKALEAQEQNVSLLKLCGQTLGNDLQERQESTGRRRDAKEVPERTFRHFRKQKGEKKEGKFSEWCSKASERAARWFSGSRKRARQRW